MYAVLTDKLLQIKHEAPTLEAICREVGEPGSAQVRLDQGSGLRGFVNDTGHVQGLARYPVACAVLLTLGAAWMPYAGPVVITGWESYEGDILSLPERAVPMLQTVHRDALAVVHSEGTPGRGANQEWQTWVREYARWLETAPTPTVRYIPLDRL